MPSAVRRGNRREIEGKRKKTEGAGKEQPPEDGPLKKGSCFFWREFFFIVEAGDLVRPFLFRAACLLEMDAGGASPPLEQPAGAASGFLCGGARPGAAWVVDVRRSAVSAVRLDFAAILRSAEGSALPARCSPFCCVQGFSLRPKASGRFFPDPASERPAGCRGGERLARFGYAASPLSCKRGNTAEIKPARIIY